MVFFPILRSVLSRKETKIFLIFSLTPLLFLLSTLMHSKLFSFAGPEDMKIAFFDFYYGQFNLQFNSIIPSIALTFLSISIMRNEIQSKILFLYKDIDKRIILLMKLLSLLAVIGIYSVGYFLISLVVYYTQVAHLSYGSLDFWSKDFNFSLLSVFSVMLSYVIIAVVTSISSLYFKNGVTLVLSLMLTVLMSISVFFPTLQILFPNGYVNVCEQFDLGIGSLVLIGVTSIYCFLSYIFGVYHLRKLEF